jgi:hypothetical protein
VSYGDSVGTEPLREDEVVREVEGHHKSQGKSDSRSDAGLIVDFVQPDMYRSASASPGALVQQWTTKALVTTKT